MAIYLYQIAYSKETLNDIEKGFLCLNNLSNERPDWYEYWPIRKFLRDEKLDDNSLYGFFSTKFGSKTGLTHEQVASFVQDNSTKADVFLFSPQPDMGAFFLNVYEQAELFDPGLIDVYSSFLSHVGFPVPVGNLVMDSRNVVFSNYFVAPPSFWREWLSLNEMLFDICEGDDSPLKSALCVPTTYPGSAQRKVFLQERTASLLLATHSNWRSVAYNPFGMSWSTSRFRNFTTEAVISDALKMAFRDHHFPQYLDAFAEIRKRFVEGVGS
jgi:hypothetical protein